jgi:hypothetical protein
VSCDPNVTQQPPWPPVDAPSAASRRKVTDGQTHADRIGGEMVTLRDLCKTEGPISCDRGAVVPRGSESVENTLRVGADQFIGATRVRLAELHQEDKSPRFRPTHSEFRFPDLIPFGLALVAPPPSRQHIGVNLSSGLPGQLGRSSRAESGAGVDLVGAVRRSDRDRIALGCY